jgi:hypothetical protein
MGCYVISVLSLMALLTITLRHKKTSKVIPFRYDLNLRLLLILCQYVIIGTGLWKSREMPFFW